jgi:K+-transporting ATPase ATPase B chain
MQGRRRRTHSQRWFDAAVCDRHTSDSFRKLAPWHAVKSPVMAVVWGGTMLTALITALAGRTAPALAGA